jgi:hypothetical protein
VCFVVFPCRLQLISWSNELAARPGDLDGFAQLKQCFVAIREKKEGMMQVSE